MHFETFVFFASVAGHLLVITSWPLAAWRWRFRLEAQWVAGLTCLLSVLVICVTTAGVMRTLRGERAEFADYAIAPMSIGPTLVLVLVGIVCARAVRWKGCRAEARRASVAVLDPPHDAPARSAPPT